MNNNYTYSDIGGYNPGNTRYAYKEPRKFSGFTLLLVSIGAALLALVLGIIITFVALNVGGSNRLSSLVKSVDSNLRRNGINDLENVSDEDLYKAIVSAYGEAAGDPYARYLTKAEMTDDMEFEGESLGLGFSIKYVSEYYFKYNGDKTYRAAFEVSMIHGLSPAAAKLQLGDIVVAVNGMDIYENPQAVYDVLFESKSEGKTYVFTVIRGAELKESVERPDTYYYDNTDAEYITISIAAAKYSDPSVFWKISETDPTVAILTVNQFKSETAEAFITAINEIGAAGIKKVVFDLRNNPGGYLDATVKVLDYMLPKGTPLFSVSDSKGDRVDYTASETSGAPDMSGWHISILFNEGSASASEIFIACLRDNKKHFASVTLVGEKSYGKGIGQGAVPVLWGQGYIYYTQFRILPPCGISYHGIGINPDNGYAVKPRIPYPKNEAQDNVLQKGIEAVDK